MPSRGVTSNSIGTYALATKVGRGSSASYVGRAAIGVVAEPITAGWEPMSRYNPYVSDGAPTEGTLRGFWQRDIKSAGAAVTVNLSLDKPALGGETITWASDGDAVEDTHWTTTSAKTVTLVRGQRSFSVVITPKETGKWYRERTTKLRLTATGIKIHEERGFVHLIFNSSVLPPTLSLSGDSRSSATTLTFTVTADYAVQDAVTLRAEIDATSALTNYTIAGLKLPVIAAGATSGTFTVTKNGGTSGTGNLIIALVYERGGNLFKEADYDPDLETFVTDRWVHKDQNLWHQSNDISLLRFNDEASDPIRPVTPGHPCSHEGGGAESLYVHEGEAMGIPQDDDTKLLDPITGNALMLFHPSDYVTAGMTYLREGFNVSYGGGDITAHKIRPYVMVRWYFKEMVGDDAARNAEFVHLRVRLRNNNRNHGITFRFSYKLESSDSRFKKHFEPGVANGVGTSVGGHWYTFPSSDTGLTVWEYAKWNGHEVSDAGWGTYYGAGEDSNGTYLWFQHHCDDDQSYATVADAGQQVHTGTTTANDADWWIVEPGRSYPDPDDPDVKIYREYSTEDTPVAWQPVSSGNPIEYPIASFGDDQSAHVTHDGVLTNRLGQIRLNRVGTLVHSMQFTMSDTIIAPPNATTGRFWPCEKSGWDPQGLGVIADTGTAHKHTVSIS